MRGKVTYVPGPLVGLTQKCFWWSSNNISGYKYPAILLSAPYFMKESRDSMLIENDVLVVGDSGGFQILTGKIDWLEPISILRWQEANCDIGIALDVPPVSSINSIPNSSFVEKCAEKSARNYEIAERNRRSDKLILLKPLQGTKLEHLEIWYNSTKSIELDGYALAPKPIDDPMVFALQVIFIHEREEQERTHIFLGSGLHVIPVIIYSTYFFKSVTFDSTVPSTYGANRIYTIFYAPTSFRIQIPSRRNPPNMRRLPCDCPVCSKVSYADFCKGENDAVGLFVLHNLFTFLKYIHVLDALCDDKDLFLQYVESFCKDETTKAIEMMMYYEEGHATKECYKKFLPYFKFSRQQSLRQSRLI